jgi:N-acyl-D-aspartate/D-glutamate deacylase
MGLYWYQFVTTSQIAYLGKQIRLLDADIATSTKDRDIIVADILASASIRPSIDLKGLVRSFRSAAWQAGVRLQWFSVNDDTISSTLSATRDANGTDPVQIIIDMMRNNTVNTGLSLVPIHSLVGSSSERTTSVSFRILPTNSPTNATK